MPVRWTIQLRLTLVYAALFVVAGALMLAITYVLVARFQWLGVPTPDTPIVPGPLPGEISEQQLDVDTRLDRQRQADLQSLLVSSGIALAVMTVVSVGLAWLAARRALRPLRTIAVTTREISERNLHRRLALTGPEDEVKVLADTFDGLLGRLEGAFEAQRRFVANASHELRTPLTLSRILLEVALADPDADTTELRDTCDRVLNSNRYQERLIEALLTLARSQRCLDRRVELDLSVVAKKVLDTPSLATRPDVRVDVALNPAATEGDPSLVERLVANLVDNAVRHNVPRGWVWVWTGLEDDRPTLRVVNSGPVIEPRQVGGLFQPFQRLGTTRVADDRDGLGVGLSIVEAIATAHGAVLDVRPPPEGGLDIRVRFRPAWEPR